MKIKACPFCRSHSTAIRNVPNPSGPAIFQIVCSSCGVATGGSENKAWLIKVWNNKLKV